MSKSKTKTIVFKRKPSKTAYFVGIPQQVPEDQAEEYIKLDYAVDPNPEPEKKEPKKAKKKSKSKK
jgi:hypothetical protein